MADSSDIAGQVGVPFWWDDGELDLPANCEAASALPERADAVVVGGGYSGLSGALTLARGGRSVVVLDSEAPGFGCSSRNGGLIGTSFHKLGLQGLSAAHGEAKAQAVLEESMATLEHLCDFIAAEGIQCHLKRVGRFRGAIRESHYDRLARELETYRKSVGLEAYMVPRMEQHDAIGSDVYYGGAIYPNDGHLHPGLYIKGLIGRVRDAGARLFGKTRVTGVERDGEGFRVQIAGGRQIAAGQLLVTTNGYTTKAFPELRRRLIPIRSAIIATETLPEDVAKEISPRQYCFGDTSRLVLYYRPSPDGRRMIFGGRAFDLADKPDHYIRDLSAQMTRIFPQLKGRALTHAWSGTVAYTFDHAPHLGALEKNLYFAMGYCGSGVGRATYFGRKAALKMLGDPEGASALDGISFDSRPFYNGTPWFIPALVRWHAAADRFGL